MRQTKTSKDSLSKFIFATTSKLTALIHSESISQTIKMKSWKTLSYHQNQTTKLASRAALRKTLAVSTKWPGNHRLTMQVSTSLYVL